MKKHWEKPQLKNLTTKETHTDDENVQCNNSICISKCKVCGGCMGSKTKLDYCTYYANLSIKLCENTEVGGCKLPQS